MIVRRLQLHPFAGTAGREFVFAPGLNVVLGPNEAGKTTLGKALRQALFVSTKLTKRQGDAEVLPYLPIGGGDTIRVSVDLESDGQTWKLCKRWVAGDSGSELQLPGGGVISDPAAVDARLAEILGLSRGTWEHVLFAHQGGVGSALDRIGEGDAVDDLNEVLRRAVFETDGVSIEALGESIAARWENAFGRWDRELNRPEGNRGLENPWSRGAGSIVEAWYEKERARIALEEAETYYRELDGVTARLNAAASESETLRNWVEDRTPVATDTEKRVGLEGKLAQIAAKETELKKVSQEWPVAESKAGELEAQAAGLHRKAETLSSELAKAQAWEAVSRTRRTLEQAAKLQAEIDQARRALSAAPRVSAEQIDTLDSLEQERIRLRSRLEAAKLGVSFNARKAIDLETRAGVEPSEEHSLAVGQSLEFEAGARAVIRHADWELEVRSGDIDIAAEESRHREIAAEAEGLLKKLGAADLPGARKHQAGYQEKSQQLGSLDKQLAELLGEKSLDDLRSEVEKTGSSGEPRRASAEIAEERGQTAAASQNVASQAAEKRQQLTAWKSSYQSPEDLLDQLIERRAERQQLDAEIAALRPLPEGFGDTQVFLAEFRRKKQELDDRKTDANSLLVEKAALEARAPDLEPAEAAEQLAQAESAFERAVKTGDAVDRIRRDFEILRAEMDEGTLEPWLAHLAEVVSPLTEKRYREIDLAEGAFARDDEVKIPFEALSMGTRACLGLGVRLSMARWFLEDRNGFLILDDPLVDLDPERQEAAALILQHFAREKQVILLTCHPRHAEILGGERIEL